MSTGFHPHNRCVCWKQCPTFLLPNSSYCSADTFYILRVRIVEPTEMFLSLAASHCHK